MNLCEKHGLLSDNSVRVVGKAAYCFITQIPYRMVKCQAISHPVRNLNAGGLQASAINVRRFALALSVAAGLTAEILFCPGGDATHQWRSRRSVRRRRES